MVLGNEPRAFHVLGKCSITELYLNPYNLLVVSNNSFENVWSLVVYLQVAYIAYQCIAFKENHLFGFVYPVIQQQTAPPRF